MSNRAARGTLEIIEVADAELRKEVVEELIFARNEVTKQYINITNFIYGFATLAMRTNIIS